MWDTQNNKNIPWPQYTLPINRRSYRVKYDCILEELDGNQIQISKKGFLRQLIFIKMKSINNIKKIKFKNFKKNVENLYVYSHSISEIPFKIKRVFVITDVVKFHLVDRMLIRIHNRFLSL